MVTTATAVVTIFVIVGVLAAVGSKTPSVKPQNTPTQAAPAQEVPTTPSETPTPTPTQASDTGPVGTTFTVTGSDGTSYDITLVKVLDPAQGANEFSTPEQGKRFVGAKFTVKTTAGTVSENANNNAAIQGSDNQMYTSDFSEISAGTNFNNGDIHLRKGGSVTGWVTFQVPQNVKVTSVQWSPESGFSNAVATWTMK